MPNLFRPVARTRDGLAAPPCWSGNEEQAVLWDAHTGRVLAEVHHDGYGKFASTVYVSLVRGLRLMIERKGLFLTLRPFPRIGLQLLDRRDLAAACRDVERHCRGIELAEEGLTVRRSAGELKVMIGRGEDRTDWRRAAATTQAEIEAQIAADPDEAGLEVDWAKAAIERPAR